MKKVPTLFVRDRSTHRVIDEVTPGCEWALNGEGRATRKFDGTCVLIDHVWYDGTQIAVSVRCEVKPGKPDLEVFVLAEADVATGKRFGWLPYGLSDLADLLDEALGDDYDVQASRFPAGTYELCGPKINGNPEGFTKHVLVRHGAEEIVGLPLTFDGLLGWLFGSDFEGIVWHHPDGRMAKLKRRDFGFTAGHPSQETNG